MEGEVGPAAATASPPSMLYVKFVPRDRTSGLKIGRRASERRSDEPDSPAANGSGHRISQSLVVLPYQPPVKFLPSPPAKTPPVSFSPASAAAAVEEAKSPDMLSDDEKAARAHSPPVAEKRQRSHTSSVDDLELLANKDTPRRKHRYPLPVKIPSDSGIEASAASPAGATFTLRPKRRHHRPATILMNRDVVRAPISARDLIVGPSMREYSDFMNADLGGAPPPGIFSCQWVVAAPRGLVFLFHGLHEHTGRFERFVDELTPRGFCVFGLDMPGHGKSGGDRGYFHSADGVVRVFVSYVRRTLAKFPGVPVFLAGHFFGSTVALLSLARLTGLISGAVLSCPFFGSADVSRIARGWMKVACVISPHSTSSEMCAAAPSPEDLRSDALCRSGPVRTRVASEVMHAARAAASLLPDELSIPLLFLEGSEDTSCEVGVRMLLERAAAKEKSLRVYPGLRRDIIVGFDPAIDVTVRDVAQWLTERAAAAAAGASPRTPLGAPDPSPPSPRAHHQPLFLDATTSPGGSPTAWRRESSVN